VSRFAELDAQLSTATIKCKLCRELEQLAEEDAAYIRAMLAAPLAVKGHKHISAVLKAGGVDVSDSTVATCRNGGHQADAA
jgi:hypothetical protein